MKKILVIEDDRTIVQGLEAALKFHDFLVCSAGDGPAGLKMLKEENPDLVILDIMLPGLNGFETCRYIRENTQQIPIIILSAKSEESDKLLGFELGADDYVTKPFSARELVARVKANLKRSRGEEASKSIVQVGNARINFGNFTITHGEKEYALSPKEHGILKLLVFNPEKVITRTHVIDAVWGDEYFPTPKTIDNFIRKLRTKIEKDPAKPEYILTVHGAGYKFKPKP